MKRTIYFRMCLVAVFAVLLTFAATITVNFYTLQTQMRSELEKQAIIIAESYNHAENKNAFLESLASLKSPRITVISEKGKVIFDNFVDVTTMENHNERPEVVEARQRGKAQKVRVSGTLDEQVFYYAVRLNDETIVRLAHTISVIPSTFKQTLPLIIILVLLIFFLTTFVSSRLIKKIVAPLNQLDLDNPLENEIYEELTPLLTKIHKQNNQIKRQMELLAKNKEEFRAITENMAEGMVLFDCQMNIISVNRSAINLLKAKHQDYSGLHLIMLTRNIVITDIVEKALQGQNSNKVLKTDSAYLEVLASPVKTKDKVIGCLLLILDSSDKFMAEQSRKEFTANVSHELKTPLTSISGYAEMIVLGLAEEKKVKEFAQKIHDEARRLISLVEDILELSKLDEKVENKILKGQPVNLREICERVVDRLTIPAKQKNISFLLEGSDTYVKGDMQMLEELVYNLCDNAVKYNTLNGQVKISLKEEKEEALLIVADTGVGIPHQELPRIFERFYRIDKSRSKEVGGTGLGLSIVKHIAIYHGAEIEVKSKPGQGSKFIVKFPLKLSVA